MDDADLELAVKAIVDSRVINSGQVCNCAERVYVQKGIYDQFVNRLGEAMQAVQFGNLAERNDIAMGPLINAAALERVEQKVARAVEEGREWRWGQGSRGERILLSADIAAGCSPGNVDYARGNLWPGAASGRI